MYAMAPHVKKIVYTWTWSGCVDSNIECLFRDCLFIVFDIVLSFISICSHACSALLSHFVFQVSSLQIIQSYCKKS